jgi:hypothetical protein
MGLTSPAAKKGRQRPSGNLNAENANATRRSEDLNANSRQSDHFSPLQPVGQQRRLLTQEVVALPSSVTTEFRVRQILLIQEAQIMLANLSASVRRFHEDEDGMETLQAVLIIAIAAIALIAVKELGERAKTWMNNQADTLGVPKGTGG